ncbi:MAG: response regulator [Candidatus Hydrogenedens sp.]|nr:response regulator [Candidatus Hydrogenedens sp.]
MLLRQGGIESVETCHDSRRVRELVAKGGYSAVVLDLTMPHFTGEEVLAQLREVDPSLPVIVMTGLNEVETAVRCMKAGAFDYMVKPVEATRLVSGVRRALEIQQLHRELDDLKQHMLADSLSRPEAFESIITQSPRMRTLFNYIEAVAPGSRPVLVTGETGSGKELFARAVHLASGRKGPLVTVNAAGLDDHVFSDTLFGHKRGAFTGAEKERAGLVSQAAGGTLFLDEIGDLSPASQVKLLRLLQDNEFLPLGSDTPVRSTARVVAATNVDLRAAQETPDFRSDLYYRLQGHTVQIPPLRERMEDLPLLVRHFAKHAAGDLSKPVPSLPKELFPLLATYHFPGNIRELEAVVYDGVSRCNARTLSLAPFKKHIDRARDERPAPALPPDDRSPMRLFGDLPTLKEVQVLLIDEAMRRADGSQSLAARLLGITQSGLSKALKRLRDADS